MLESAALGVTSLLATAIAYGGALLFLPADEARALAFVVLIAGNLMLILVNRSRDDSLVTVLRRPNAAFWWICMLAATALTVVVVVPQVASAFAFDTPPSLAVLGAVVIGAGVILVAGYLRVVRRRRAAGRHE